VIWTCNPPAWMFDEATLRRATVAPGNPGCVDVELHSCRYRLGFAPNHRRTRRLSRGWPLCRRSRSGRHSGRHGRRQLPATDQQPVQPPPDSRRSS
jgi:hypothetical protein